MTLSGQPLLSRSQPAPARLLAGLAPAQLRDPLALLFLAATIAASLLVLLLGATVLWLSFTVGLPGDPELTTTLANYRALAGDGFAFSVLGNTILFALLALAVALSIGFTIAYLCERTDLAGKGGIYTLMSVSLLLPNFAVALGWIFLLNPQIGLVNAALKSLLGLEEAPFNIASLTGMGLVEGLSLVPVAFVMSAAALRSMDPSLEEAASMSAASAFGSFRRVTLPVLAPAVLGITIYIFTLAFAAFDVPAVIGLSRRIFTFSTYIYYLLDQTTDVPKYGLVAGLSVVMIAIGALLGWYYNRLQRNAARYAVVTGKGFRPRLVPLRGWRSAAVAFVLLYFLMAQGLPLLVTAWAACLPYLQMPSAEAFAQLTTANLVRVMDRRFTAGLTNTGILMLLVPTVTVAFSLAISWVVVRSRLKFRFLFDFFAFLPHTIPAVVFSVAALFVTLFLVQKIVPLYGTIWLLVIVYAVSRLGYGTRMTNASLLQIHRELEEAAAVSGASFAHSFCAVLLPLLAPTLLYSWIWIALLSYRELTLPILLSGRDNLPLSVVVWSYLQTSAYGPAASITLVMVAILSPMIALYWLAARRVGLVSGR